MAVVLPFCRPLIRMAVINGGVNNDYNRASRFEGEFGVTDLTWETVEKLNVGNRNRFMECLGFASGLV